MRFLLPLTAAFFVTVSTMAWAADDAKSIEDLLNASEGIITTEDAQKQEAAATPAQPNVSPKKLDIGKTGLQLPRYVSLKRNLVNVRKGPNESFAIAWTFTRKNLPVEIIAEYDNWRKVRDHSGAEGWVFHSLLSGSRYALVTPWKTDAHFTLHTNRDDTSNVVAKIEAGLLGAIESCNGTWCQMTAKDNNDDNAPSYKGFIKQEYLWGIYLDDTIE